jgi:hypothetical protein
MSEEYDARIAAAVEQINEWTPDTREALGVEKARLVRMISEAEGYGAILSENVALRARVAELEKDAARLDWLDLTDIGKDETGLSIRESIDIEMAKEQKCPK